MFRFLDKAARLIDPVPISAFFLIQFFFNQQRIFFNPIEVKNVLLKSQFSF